ncbi:DUF1800 domain-containing protein [Winogradskyella sp. DF17]|uniref:DUF1800 domain-containing protein n=1 Tax=Winogradskyella pelagia TaxID=2819984 RepID=A0ABS3SY35_9FLAO|nr:DUF1800 domain-containing protein [Winogradskyella sp. DF17]MBO3115403.1 DUF1800 domain-containing protein [Winogradskyella sp. DF17]
MESKDIQHLYWRAAFGISPRLLDEHRGMDRAQVVHDLFANASDISPLSIDTSELDHYQPSDFVNNKQKRNEFIQKSMQYILKLNTSWIERLMDSPGSLRERMTLFWANHFVCKDRNIYHVQNYNNTLRAHALGNFGDFVRAISKEAAMLKYLNSNQNRKQKPNENFARELLELFTLGEGNYTEKDIKECARAFTGYSHNFQGEFILRPARHDNGYKFFLGSTGRYDGDDIIDIILQQKQCARFVCVKIYTYFVNSKINQSHVDAMTEVFYKDYNIEKLMHFVFTSDWFYETQNIGSKIKSPIALLVGMAQTVPLKFEEPKDLLKIQRILGQTLLDPPNVAGWKGDKAWIDANTIMVRLKLPSLLLNNAIISLKEQGDFNDSFREQFYKRVKNKLPFKTVPYWESFMSSYNAVKTENLSELLIQGAINEGTIDYLQTLSKKSKRDYCIQLMSLPEYQMC